VDIYDVVTNIDHSVRDEGFSQPSLSTASSYSDLKQSLAVCEFRDDFLYNKCSTLITFIKLSDSLFPKILIAVVIDAEFKAHIRVTDNVLGSSHEILKSSPECFDTVDSIRLLITVLSSWTLCPAVNDSVLTAFLSRRDASIAITDDARNHVSVRSKQCHLLINSGLRCDACQCFRRCLLMRHLRNKHCAGKSDVTKSTKPNTYLSSPLRLAKLKLLARKSRGLGKRVSVLETQLEACRKKCMDVIADDGEMLIDADCKDVAQLTRECKETALAQFPVGSFQHTFYEQQLKYNKMKNKASMRWHPAIIRWCLLIKSKSAKIYTGLRAVLSLPSSRTLYDYTHYMESRTGINPKTAEQLIVKATNLGCYTADHKSYVGILEDEIKIKCDLVYHKTTGELIGYVSLDNVANELLNIEQHAGSDRQLAEHMLVSCNNGERNYNQPALSLVRICHQVFVCQFIVYHHVGVSGDCSWVEGTVYLLRWCCSEQEIFQPSFH